MANKPAVTLTLAGDEKKLLDSFDRAGRGGAELDDKITKASRGAEQAGKRFDDVANHADNAGKSFGGMAGSLDKAGSAMAIKAAAIGLSIASAFSGIFQQANVGGMLAAQLGGGSERAGELGKLAGKVYADNFGDSIQDAGEALTGVIGSNLVDEDAIDEDIVRVTEKLSTVAQVMKDETGNVAIAVQQMIRTGMVKNAEQGFDLLVRAQQQGLNKSGDLLETLNEYGTQYRKLGIDGPIALGLISQAMRGGARDSDIAADAIKEISIRAIDGSKASQNAFHDLGLNGDKMAALFAKGGDSARGALDTVIKKLQATKDPLVQSSAATGLFGTQWEDLGASLLSFNVGTATDALGEVTGATDEAMAAIGDTPEAKFESFKRNMETKLIDVVNKATPLLMGLGNFISQNTDVLLPLAVAIGIITVAQWAWNAAMAANPIILIIGLIAGLVFAFVTLWNKSADFRDFFIGIWEGISGTLGRVFGAIPTAFKAAMNVVVEYLNWHIRRINDIIHGINWISSKVGIPGIPDVPEIPRMHSGGVFQAPGGGEGLALLKSGERVSAPGQGGGGTLRVAGTGALAELLQSMIRDGDLVLEGR